MSRRLVPGFTLIEVLVSMMILSVALLGIARMQVGGVRGSQDAYYRSQATGFANDMAERMYGNLPGVRAGNYAGIDSNSVGCGTAPAAQCGVEDGATTTTSCSPANMANYDSIILACGYKKSGGGREGGVKDVLPNGRIQIVCVSTTGAPAACPAAGSRHRIIVSWSDQATTDSSGLLTLGSENVTMLVQP